MVRSDRYTVGFGDGQHAAAFNGLMVRGHVRVNGSIVPALDGHAQTDSFGAVWAASEVVPSELHSRHRSL